MIGFVIEIYMYCNTLVLITDTIGKNEFALERSHPCVQARIFQSDLYTSLKLIRLA